MTENDQAFQETSQNQNLASLSQAEQEFVKKANNAGLSVSFTPHGASAPLTFTPSEAQINNAQRERLKSSDPQEGLPYADLLNEKAKRSDIGIISHEEADQVPYLPNMRNSFFQTLTPETKTFVLRANLSGLNVTAKGTNGKSFLYLAPQNDQAREQMKQDLASLEKQGSASFEQAARVVPTSEQVPLSMARNTQHQ